MLIRILYVVLLFTAITSAGIAQSKETYVRASINLKGKDFPELAKAGIETDHGLLVPGRYFISDFSVSELELIKKIGFTCDVLIENVSEFYASPNRNDDESMQLNRRPNRCDGLPAAEYNYETPVNYRPGTMNGYFTYSEIMQHLDDMAEKYPDLISRRASIEGFPTHNGNLLQYIKLSDNVDKDEEEPEVLYTALHHAREPNSVSQMIFFLWYLLENYGKNDIVTKIVNETELYFLPCINPDGYLQNQLTNPNGGGLWRKNMWKDSLGNLKGVDLNRNYGFFWGYDNVGSSVNPNSQTYRGTKPFSEPETQAIRAFCLGREFSMALNYHTFGNYLIHPWGYNDLPTDENTLFKGMGSVINQENQFKMGTGIETVGYTVNGVSDDWMYGDNGEKNKIYSYTPEVGPSFWPAPGSIDRLNKSCVWMNMATALLTLSFYEASDDRDDGILTPQNARITLSVSRFGLKPGSCTLRLKPKVEGVRVLNGEIQATLELGSSQQVVFELDIDQGMITDPELYFTLEIDNEGIVTNKEISRLWVPDPLIAIYENNASSKLQISGNGWSLTEKTFVSSPTSVTDSESGNYASNAELVYTYVKPVDLTLAKNVFLEFYAKWDIEASYDYVQVLASRDSIDFIPLCGKYTRPGTADQDFNSPLYDGKQEDWVREFIDMSDFAGSEQVWLRFKLKSDEYLEKDGFYVDDLRVMADISESHIDQESTDYFIKIDPNLISLGEPLQIKGTYPGDEVLFSLYNAIGQKVFEQKLESSATEIQHTINIGGVYYYTFTNQGSIVGSGKCTLY